MFSDILLIKAFLLDFLLQNILQLCKNRVMLFDNCTRDRTKRAKQVNKLFSLVDLVVTGNGGKPFSDDIFNELKVHIRSTS